MQGFVITLLICSVTMSALALFYMAITPILAKRYSVTGRYYAWLVIVIGLIIPFRPQFDNAMIKVAIPGNTMVPNISTENGLSVISPVQNASSHALTNISWWQIAAAVWIVGMILFLSYYAIKHYHFLKLTARWSENVSDEQTLILFQNLKTQLGLTQNITLQFCDSIGSPMMIGFAKPRILLSKADFTKEELRFILMHELIHYKRKDLWYKCLVLMATAIHWFNPIIYWVAKTIAIQCELSCDKGVVCSADADTRQHYSETIISVVRNQSKLKTALSTNFYGGKKGMKERIFSIRDSRTKKAGMVVLGGAMILTFGTGFAFASNAKTQTTPPRIQEAIQEDLAFGYHMLPNPEIYSNYLSYGITISDDGEKLLYNGERVRLFVDEKSDVQAFFLDEEGALDLSVIRNADGNITKIESISEAKAQEYRSAFFADDIHAAVNAQETTLTQEITGQNKYEQYSAYGITLSADGKILYYNGQRVKLLVDELSERYYETFWTDEAGAANLSIMRNSIGNITGIERISEEQAQTYYNSLDESEEKLLKDVEVKVAQRMKELYPEN